MPKSELIKGDHPPFLLAPPHHIFWGEIKFPGRSLNLGNSRGALLFRVCRRRWRDLPLGRGAALGEVMGRQHCQPGQGCPLEMSRRSSAQENKPTSFMSPTDIKRPLPHCTQPPVRRREVCTSDWGQGPRGWGTPQGLGISERGFPTPPQGPRDALLLGSTHSSEGPHTLQGSRVRPSAGWDMIQPLLAMKRRGLSHHSCASHPAWGEGHLFMEGGCSEVPHPPEPQFPPL